MSIYYFAYGSCMDEVDFNRTVPVFEVLGSAILRNYRLAFTLYGESRGGGVADIISAPGQEVQGVLYSFSNEYLPHLDQREGVHLKKYERIEVDLLHKGQIIKAYTYQVINKSEQEITPTLHYTGLLLNGMDKFASARYRLQFIEHLHTTFGLQLDLSEQAKETGNVENRRRHERVALNIPLTLTVHQFHGEGAFQGQSTKGVLEDISEEGLRIKTDLPLNLDMFLRIQLPKEAGMAPLIGRIIRCEARESDYHYGCLVTGLTLLERRNLEAYISKHKAV